MGADGGFMALALERDVEDPLAQSLYFTNDECLKGRGPGRAEDRLSWPQQGV